MKGIFSFRPFITLKSAVRFIVMSILMFQGSLFCQVRFCNRGDLPKGTGDFGPFVDTLNQKVWYFQVAHTKAKWEHLDLREYISFEACGHRLILNKLKGGGKILGNDIFVYVDEADFLYCGDSILTIYSGKRLRMLSLKKDYALASRDIVGLENVRLETLEGKQGYCVSAYYGATYMAIHLVADTNLRTWGILDRDTGQWLIEPKFDGPFIFQNGFAEVIYYGQKRKINEKGEFVE
jgi:hypothetical protein